MHNVKEPNNYQANKQRLQQQKEEDKKGKLGHFLERLFWNNAITEKINHLLIELRTKN